MASAKKVAAKRRTTGSVKSAKPKASRPARPRAAAPKAARPTAKRTPAPKRAPEPPKRTPAALKRPAPRQRTQPESLRLRAMAASLTVNDLERSLRFYRDGLGFVVVDRWEEGGELVGYMLRAGSCEIGIGKDDWAKGHDRVKGVGLRLWCETAQDVDTFAARVRSRGYALTEEPADRSWGVRSFAVDDPDGFHLSIYRRLGD